MIEPEVVFEDESVLVLNKPAGWVVNRVDSTDAPLVADWVDEHLGLVHSSTEMQQGKNAATSYTVAGYHVLSETVKQKLIKLVKKNYRNQNEIYTLLDLQPET